MKRKGNLFSKKERRCLLWMKRKGNLFSKKERRAVFALNEKKGKPVL
jgi:hypothetical protein